MECFLKAPPPRGAKMGKDGLPGVGFKLTPAGDFDLQSKRLTNVAEGTGNSDAITKHQVDTLATQLRADSLQVDGSSHMTGDLDLRGQKLINPGEIEMNRKLITNLDTDENNDLSAVNMITLKKFHPNAPAPTHEVTKDIDLKDQFSVINSKENVLSFYKSHYATLMPFADIQDNFLSRVEEFPMQTQLNMNHNSITNLKDPVFGGEAATKAYIDSAYSTIVSSTATSIATKLDLSGGKMTGSIDMNKNKVINLSKPTEVNDAVNMDYVNTKIEKIKKRIAKNTITATSHPKDEFRYLMEDVDESSSESNISVTGIVDFQPSPHLFNKKAYAMKIDKRSSTNLFVGRIGFNMYKIPEGEYTICVEFFPGKMDGVSVSARATSLNVNRQATKEFAIYSRTIIHMHKWHISPPEFLMLDLRWQGTAEDSSPGDAHLIIYGVKEFQPDVENAVYDSPFVFENGEMVMQTGLNLNGHKLTAPTQSVVLGRFEKGKHSDCLIFSNEKEDDNYWQYWGVDFKIKSVALFSGQNLNMALVVRKNNSRRFGGTSVGNTPVFTFNQKVEKDDFFFSILGGAFTNVKAAMLIEIG